MLRLSLIGLAALLSAHAVRAAPADRLNPASLAPLPAAAWDRAAAAHLLRRAAFGGSADDVDRATAMGPAAAVDALLDFSLVAYAPPGPRRAAAAIRRPNAAELRRLPEAERQAIQAAARAAERETFEEVRLWWLERMLTTPRPLEEVLTLCWHGHFTSGMREVRDADFMLRQNELLRSHAAANFGELVLAICRDPAMLRYLDGNRNVRRSPNENFARELLELFTLGVGYYSEDDVRAAARAFTGWSVDENGFVFRAQQHDGGPKTFLGRSGTLDGEDIVARVLQQRAASRHLATRLLRFFCRPDPPPQLVDALAAEIRRRRFELRPVLRTLLLSQAFYHPDARGALVKSPTVLLVGTARHLDITVHNLPALQAALLSMGQELMQPPNVKGWDGGMKWINAATLYARYNAVRPLLVGAGGDAGDADRSDYPTRRVRHAQPPYDPLPALQQRALTSPAAVVDFYADLLLAVPLHEDKRRTLVDYLAGPDGDFSLDRRDTAARVRETLHLLMSTPEYQMH